MQQTTKAQQATICIFSNASKLQKSHKPDILPLIIKFIIEDDNARASYNKHQSALTISNLRHNIKTHSQILNKGKHFITNYKHFSTNFSIRTKININKIGILLV